MHKYQSIPHIFQELSETSYMQPNIRSKFFEELSSNTASKKIDKFIQQLKNAEKNYATQSAVIKKTKINNLAVAIRFFINQLINCTPSEKKDASSCFFISLFQFHFQHNSNSPLLKHISELIKKENELLKKEIEDIQQKLEHIFTRVTAENMKGNSIMIMLKREGILTKIERTLSNGLNKRLEADVSTVQPPLIADKKNVPNSFYITIKTHLQLSKNINHARDLAKKSLHDKKSAINEFRYSTFIEKAIYNLLAKLISFKTQTHEELKAAFFPSSRFKERFFGEPNFSEKTALADSKLRHTYRA